MPQSSLKWLNANCFREILAIEKSLEARKVDLCLQPDFSLEQAYAFFAPSTVQKVDLEGLQTGM